MKQFYLILIIFITTPIFADLTTDIAICAETKDSIQRLACFDKLSEDKDLTRKPEIKQSDNWTVDIDKSKIDDSQTVILINKSKNEVIGQYNNSTRPTLLIRCEENKTDAFISTTFFLGSDSFKVTTRLDKEKARKETWSISTNHKAMFIRQPVSYLKKMMKHENLLVEFSPYSGNRKLVEFDISNLEEVIKPLRKECNW